MVSISLTDRCGQFEEPSLTNQRYQRISIHYRWFFYLLKLSCAYRTRQPSRRVSILIANRLGYRSPSCWAPAPVVCHFSSLNTCHVGNAIINNTPFVLFFKQLQKIQSFSASFVRKTYFRCSDVINLEWLPMKERSQYSIAQLAWKSINKTDWPKSLPSHNEVLQDISSSKKYTRLRQTFRISVLFWVWSFPYIQWVSYYGFSKFFKL